MVFFRELQLDLCFWFSTLSSLFPQPLSSKPPFFPSTQQQQSTHSTHERAGNAVNDNTLALFLFTTPHHHFTRPSLPSHSPHHSSSLLTHCVQPLSVVSPTMSCKHLWSCNSHTTAFLSPHSHLPHSLTLCDTLCFIPLRHESHAKHMQCRCEHRPSKGHHNGATQTTWVQFHHNLMKYSNY